MNLTRKRMIEWWALLNCYVRPSDMQSDDSEADAFHFIDGFIPKVELLSFWNGDFRFGLNRNRYK